MSKNNGMDRDSTDQFGRPFNDWLNKIFKKRPQPTKTDPESTEHDRVAQFVGEFEQDPRAAYKRYSPREISELMEQADKRGLMTPARRQKIWSSVQPEKMDKDSYDEGRRERMRSKGIMMSTVEPLDGYPPKK